MHDSAPSSPLPAEADAAPVGSAPLPFRLFGSPIPVWCTLALITAGGLYLRLQNNDFGQPHVYHTDEKRKINAISHMFDKGTLDPGYFNHPGFLLYTSGGASIIARHVFGLPKDRMTILKAGRTWVGVLGALTLVVAFLLARALARGILSRAGTDLSSRSPPGPGEADDLWKADRAGLIAAAGLAVFPLHVVCSHYMKEDIPLTLWVSLSLLFAMRVARRGRDTDYLLATACCSMALSTKYVGVLSFICLWVAHWIQKKTWPGPRIIWAWLRRFGSGWRCVLVVGIVTLGAYLVAAKHLMAWRGVVGAASLVLFLFALAFNVWKWRRSAETKDPAPPASKLARRMIALGILLFLLINPYAVLNYRGFGRNFDYEARHGTIKGHHGHRVSPWRHVWTFHLRRSLQPGMTLPPLAAALISLLLIWRTRERGGRMLVGAALIWYLAHEASGLKPPPNFDRYMNPVLPLLAAALATALLLILAEDVKSRSGLRALTLLVSVLLFTAPLARSWALVTQMKPDTRDEAFAWCLDPANIPPGSQVLLNGYGPPVSEAPCLFEWAYASRMHRESHKEGPLDLQTGLFPLDVDKPEKRSVLRIDFVISSSFRRDRYFDFARGEMQENERGGRAFYEALENSWPCVAEFFSPAGPYGYNNPTIRIHQRPDWKAPTKVAQR